MADIEILLLLYLTFSLFCFCHASTNYAQLKQAINCTYVNTEGGDLSDHAVWLAKRDKTITENSSYLTVNDAGKLIIKHPDGEIELYSGPFASPENLTAELEDNGNFVLKANSGGQTQILWESFDNPTDTLLPGMKLGFNSKKNKNWSLTSWLGEETPTLGAFTMEWDYIKREIIVKRRRVIFWTSGTLTSDKSFANIPLPDPYNHNYRFDIVSNGEEESVSYRLYFNEFTLVERRNISRWFLDYDGSIWDAGRTTILNSEACDGYITKYGCVKWELPNCRNDGSKFELRISNYHPDYVANDKNQSLSFSDCKDLCWKDCNCTGIRNHVLTGCSFYRGPFDFTGLTGNEPQFYAIIPGPRRPPLNKVWKWIVIALAIVVFAALVGIFLYLRWKKLEQEEKFLKELLTSDVR
ncbi:G-type lectin S-receptor-like serine/threonine-protein kinase At1g67520 [Jatropha curcas]|uniref:G-type lectin S-receptor-like serine/threonine-protein kinase At1g67520 n=1 Tax=Jatropha curcas TaxID=180498 RepID=UPI00189411FE|nr:G-type lectin S-receptor-like serine/threonine-protein kinase At1g67520 [Jatropha curcas]